MFSLSERSYLNPPLTHSHEFYQVILPTSGRLGMRVAEQPGAVEAGRWALIRPGAEHTYWAETRSGCLVVDLSGAAVEAARAQFDGLGFLESAVFLPLDERVAAMGGLLRSELRAGGASEPMVAQALGSYVGAAVARAMAARPPRPAAIDGRLARQTHAYLEAHALAPLSLTQIADAVGASVGHVQRSFRACYGDSVVAHIQRLRVDEARRMLRAGDMPIAAVAAAVGFESQSYFTRLFSRIVGVSPARYRRAG
jgi:AraC-like DNA-binding protein